MANEFARNIQDAKLKTTSALPAQNTSNAHAGIDLGAGGNFQPEGVELEIAVPATPSLADGQTLTLTVQDSADNASFAALPVNQALVLTGGGGAGAAAQTVRCKLPATTRRYVRVNQAASATAGNNTAVSVTVTLRF